MVEELDAAGDGAGDDARVIADRFGEHVDDVSQGVICSSSACCLRRCRRALGCVGEEEDGSLDGSMI
jgi:hypothetical protein